LETRSVTDWQSADDRNNREKSNRARQAAEGLFKPTQQKTAAELPTSAADGAAPGEHQPRRQPRVFTVPARLPAGEQVETPVEPPPIRPKAVTRRRTGSVPASQIGRVRALTSYGMTPAQVADLYGVTVEAIERIVREPVYAGKSR
jgi:hypothetical protein